MRSGDIEDSRALWLYGLNPVLEALKAGRQIKALYIYEGRHKGFQELRDEAKARNIPVSAVELSFFEKRFPKGHQGIAARVREKLYTPLDELLGIPIRKNETPFFLMLDGIEDPRNLGAILRSAESAGVHGVIIQKHRSAGLDGEASKASAGALEYVAVSQVSNIKNAINTMKKQGILIVAGEAGGGIAPWDIDLSVPLGLVIGGEGKGIRMTVKNKCDFLISLPMKGKVNSLNVSVATGILLYEILRQKCKKPDF